MSDLIERQAAIDALLEEVRLVDGYYVENDEVIDKDDAVEAMRLLPSAQPEIIYCRNCKHWREGDVYSYCQKLFNCGVLDAYDYMRAEDDFCSRAERREE